MALFRDPVMDGDIPREPHLGILTGDDGRVTAIPIGATVYIILDPTKADHVIPLILAKVSRRELVFIAWSGDPNNQRTVRFKAKWDGVYRSTIRNADQKLEAGKITTQAKKHVDVEVAKPIDEDQEL